MNNDDQIIKYPRTPHIQGSRKQSGDEDLEAMPISELIGKYVVIEEKLDGANSGASFDGNATMLLQSRGHFLTGSPREKHFNLFRTWAACHQDKFFDILEDKYIMYGEFLYCKHSAFFDRLDHYFFEFDIYDKSKKMFLSTQARRTLLKKSPIISVPVLWEGIWTKDMRMQDFVQRSLYKSDLWRNTLRKLAEERNLDPDLVEQQTDMSDLSEGVYGKIETENETIGRFKFVRAGFLQTIIQSESHWLDRPIIPNQLADGVDIFSQDYASA